MRNLKLFSLVLAVVAFGALYACSGGTKKEAKEVTEQPVVEPEAAADSVAVTDSVATVDSTAVESEATEAE